MKLKTCSFCGKETSKLWYSQPKCCADFKCRKLYSELKPEKGIKTSEKKKVSKIKQFSDKKQKELAVYRKLRDKYMNNHPICEWCKIKPSQDLHHKLPRAYYLCDVSVFSALCRDCHNKCESDHESARKAGFKLNHLGQTTKK